MKLEDQVFKFEKIQVSISYKEANNTSLLPERLRIEYYNLLFYRDNIELQNVVTLHNVLKALFTKNFNIRSIRTFKNELKKIGIGLNDSKFYYTLKNDANSGIITKKMLED